MFILTIKDKANDGAYAVEKKDGTRILQIFEEQDDAERYVMMLEGLDHPFSRYNGDSYVLLNGKTLGIFEQIRKFFKLEQLIIRNHSICFGY